MLAELHVIISVELILLVSIAAISLHGRRMDVLSGRYFRNRADRTISAVRNIGWLRQWVKRAQESHRLKKTRARASKTERSGQPASRGEGQIAKAIPQNRAQSVIKPAARELDIASPLGSQAPLAIPPASWG